MLCPYCGFQIPTLWRELTHTDPSGNTDELRKRLDAVLGSWPRNWKDFHTFWMACPNENCKEVIVKVDRDHMVHQGPSHVPLLSRRYSWFAVPKKGGLPVVDGSVPEHYRRDCLEAWSILEDSPRMSAVLSGKIIADLLKEYCQYEDKNLSTRIKRFIEDDSHPTTLKEDLEYAREIRNFSTHTMLDREGNVLEVGKEEAEWTLEIVAELFNYFIVGPERSKKRREKMDKTIEQAGRKSIAGSD